MTAIGAAENRLSAPASREPATPATECAPSVERQGAKLQRHAGLTPHGATGAAAIYTTANMAPRSAKGVFARLQNQWKAGETAVHSSLGPIARDSQSQHPVNRLNQISAPRFDGGASVPLPHATSAGLTEAVQQAIGELQAAAGQPAGSGNPFETTDMAGKAANWARHALFTLAMGKGPANVPAEALAMLYRHQGFQTRGEPGEGKPPVVLDHLRNVANAEKAGAVIHIARQAKLADGEIVDLQGPLQQLATAKEAAGKQAMDSANAANAETVKRLLDSVAPALRPRLQAACDILIAELNHGHAVPDTLAVELLADTARLTFAQDPEGLVAAMEGLSSSHPARLIGMVGEAFQPSALKRHAPPATPALQLACAVARAPGGHRMLARMTCPPASAAQQTALQVAMEAMVELQASRSRPAGTTMSGIEWLRAAVSHAERAVDPEGSPAVPDSQARQQLVAFRGVQNGFLTNEPGSSYDRVRQRLQKFGDGALDQTSRRNARAASGPSGRFQNWMSGGLPKAMARSSSGMEGLLPSALPALSSWLPGTRPTMWRKSVMRNMTTAASSNGMLPSRGEAVEALHRSAADIRAHLQARADAHLSAPEKLMLALLEQLGLGSGPDAPPPPQRTLKHLDKEFFQQVEARLDKEGLAGLPAGLHTDWLALRDTHPNAGHLLRLLCEHVDLRSLASGTAPSPMASTQTARGLRTDTIAHAAIASFADIAASARSAAGEGSTEAEALSRLMQATASALAAVTPPAALRALRIETFEAVERQVTLDWLAVLPEGKRPSWEEAREQVMDAWPDAVQVAWAAMKNSGVDAGRLMRTLADAAVSAAWPLPRTEAGPGPGSGTAPARAVADAVARAAPALQLLQDDVHVNRFEMAVSDMVTLFNDLRGPADAAEVMKSLAQRISLGEQIKSGDARTARLDLGKAVSLSTNAPELLAPMLGLGLGREHAMDLSMVGAAIQVQISTADSKSADIGLKVGLRGGLGHADHEFNVGNGSAGIALRFDLRLAAGGSTSTTQGVSLRMQRTAAHEDTLRRHFADVLVDLARAGNAPPDNGAETDVLASLLEHHPALVVTEVTSTRHSRTSSVGAGASATARFRGGEEQSADVRKATRRAVGAGIHAGIGASGQRSRSVRTESRSGLNVEEYQLYAQHRVNAQAGAGASMGLVPASLHDPRKAAQVRGIAVGVQKQLAYSGVGTTLRMTTRNGETWADQTQMIRQFESLDDFLAELEPRQHEFVAAMAARDSRPGAEDAEKTGRAWLRLQDTLEQAAAARAPGMTFSVVCKLRPEAAEAYDKLQGLIQNAVEANDEDRADSYRGKMQMLLDSQDAWVANNLQFKSKAKEETSQSAMLGVLQTKASGQTTRLHEFLPAGAQQVGRTPQQHAAVPRDHSGRWTPRLSPDDLAFTPDTTR
ncbi:hypothetical protein QRO11_00790 [Paracidovorax citrulli]|nr:hypothetical protein [Paracidovorax citrulli]QCX10558.1 hypothetical protein APS58_1694 [Paracidovorax citrulli]UEG46463.1 hypothetical protein LKW27_00785 [Paracidovorax citrulli]UMT90276.1 hypothetical protein FRC90_20870 [Paracidovorax citrulli]UMT94313.1 hypothetical protein FRC97_04475 [Paracidovorax citrulli]WIY34920.1 hypothetical protein QRO11_00790 [Paracidovorax citrulli]